MRQPSQPQMLGDTWAGRPVSLRWGHRAVPTRGFWRAPACRPQSLVWGWMRPEFSSTSGSGTRTNPRNFSPCFQIKATKRTQLGEGGFRGPLCFRGGRARERPVEGVGVPASSQVEAVSRGSGKDVIACARVPVHPPSPCVTPAPRT